MWTLLAWTALAFGGQQGAELTGTVRGENGPLAGANVFIATARPRRGVGIL